MIHLYTWNTPNGRKATIMLEELNQQYMLHPVNIGKGEQKSGLDKTNLFKQSFNATKF